MRMPSNLYLNHTVFRCHPDLFKLVIFCRPAPADTKVHDPVETFVRELFNLLFSHPCDNPTNSTAHACTDRYDGMHKLLVCASP